MSNQEPTIKDIFEIVEFIRDNGATKDDIASVRREISELRNEVISHVDAFVGLYQKHEAELAAVVSRQNRFEEKLNQIIQHLGLQLA